MQINNIHDTSRREALPMPDGRTAGALRVFELLPEMQRLKIPGIAADMGKGELLKHYETQVVARAEQHQPENVRGKLYPSAHHIALAVDEIAGRKSRR